MATTDRQLLAMQCCAGGYAVWIDCMDGWWVLDLAAALVEGRSSGNILFLHVGSSRQACHVPSAPSSHYYVVPTCHILNLSIEHRQRIGTDLHHHLPRSS